MPLHFSQSTALPQLTEPAEFVACNLCGSDTPRPLFPIGRFRIVECRRCGLAYTNPRLGASALRDVYDGSYFRSPDSLRHGYGDYIAEKANIQRTFRERWTKLREVIGRPGRLLEIGCAHGFLLEIAREDGWEVAGLDPSPEAVAYARDELHVDARPGDGSVIPFPDGSFDVIVLWDVIEHLPDPAATVALCARKLRDGGVISIITPDRSSLLAQLTGRNWAEYQKPQEHLYFFSRRLLRQLLERNDLRTVRTGTAGKYVDIGFALERLAAMKPWLFTPLARLAKASGLAGRVLKINPHDKMHVIARKTGTA